MKTGESGSKNLKYYLGWPQDHLLFLFLNWGIFVWHIWPKVDIEFPSLLSEILYFWGLFLSGAGIILSILLPKPKEFKELSKKRYSAASLLFILSKPLELYLIYTENLENYCWLFFLNGIFYWYFLLTPRIFFIQKGIWRIEAGGLSVLFEKFSEKNVRVIEEISLLLIEGIPPRPFQHLTPQKTSTSPPTADENPPPHRVGEKDHSPPQKKDTLERDQPSHKNNSPPQKKDTYQRDDSARKKKEDDGKTILNGRQGRPLRTTIYHGVGILAITSAIIFSIYRFFLSNKTDFFDIAPVFLLGLFFGWGVVLTWERVAIPLFSSGRIYWGRGAERWLYPLFVLPISLGTLGELFLGELFKWADRGYLTGSWGDAALSLTALFLAADLSGLYLWFLVPPAGGKFLVRRGIFVEEFRVPVEGKNFSKLKN